MPRASTPLYARCRVRKTFLRHESGSHWKHQRETAGRNSAPAATAGPPRRRTLQEHVEIPGICFLRQLESTLCRALRRAPALRQRRAPQLRIRWGIRAGIHQAFLTLGCAIICWRCLKETVLI